MDRIRTTGGATVAATALSAAVFDGVTAAAGPCSGSAGAHSEDEGNIWDLLPRDEG